MQKRGSAVVGSAIKPISEIQHEQMYKK